MSNYVIASADPACQSLAGWLMIHRGCKNTLPMNELSNGSELWIVGHDSDLGDGAEFCKNLSSRGGIPPGINYNVYLIVCSSHSFEFTKDVVTPAELIANTLGISVWASKTVVVGTWDQNAAVFTGNYQRVAPYSDLISRMQNLSINSGSDLVN